MRRVAWELHPAVVVVLSVDALAALVLMVLFNVDDALLEPRRFLIRAAGGVLLSLLATSYFRWAYRRFEQFYISFYRTPIPKRIDWDLQKKNLLIGFPAYAVFILVLIFSLAFEELLSPAAMVLGFLVPTASLWSVHQQLKVKVEGLFNAESGGNPGAA